MPLNEWRLRELVSALAVEVGLTLPPVVDPPKLPELSLTPGDDVQHALDLLVPTGGTIWLAPGLYPLNLVLRERPVNAPPLWLCSPSTKLPMGRVTRPDLPELAQVQAKSPQTPVVKAAPRARCYGFRGIAFLPQDAAATQCDLGGDDTTLTNAADRAEEMWFDHCLAFGDPVKGQHRWIMPPAKGVSVRYCSAYDFFEVSRDAQAIGGWNGVEDLLVEFCYLEGAAENFLIGGGNCASPELAPRNVRLTDSTLAKPAAWKAHLEYNVKALLEIKHLRGGYFARLVLEGCWKDDWAFGTGLAVKCANGDGSTGRNPYTQTDDLIFEDIVIRHVGNPVLIVGQNDGTKQLPTERMARIRFTNILCTDVATPDFPGDGKIFSITNVPQQLTIDHVTALGSKHSVVDITQKPDYPKADGFALTNSVAHQGQYGILAGGATGAAALAYACNGAVMTGNTFRADPARTVKYPPGNVTLSATTFDASLDSNNLVKAGSGIATATATTDGTLPGVSKVLP